MALSGTPRMARCEANVWRHTCHPISRSPARLSARLSGHASRRAVRTFPAASQHTSDPARVPVRPERFDHVVAQLDLPRLARLALCRVLPRAPSHRAVTAIRGGPGERATALASERRPWRAGDGPGERAAALASGWRSSGRPGGRAPINDANGVGTVVTPPTRSRREREVGDWPCAGDRPAPDPCPLW
jgi:hypothetical protein